MMKQVVKFALAWLAFLVLPIPLIIILNTQLVDMTSTLIVYDLGIIAYVWWLVSIILATRPHWLERQYGLPMIYFFHGFLALLALILATFHKFLAFSMFPLIKQTGNVAWYLELFLMAYAVLFLSGWLVDRSRLFAYLKRWLEQHGLYHQVTMWIHRLNWVVVALVWLHVHLIPRVNVPGFRITFDVYTLVAIVLYVFWKAHQVTAPTGTIIDNHIVGSKVQALTVEFPTNQSVVAGDFYFLAFQVPGHSKEWHPFSVAEINKNKVTFMIHQRGDFTQQIDQLPIGANVKLEGPFGMFDQEIAQSSGPILLYGLGTGIAPLIGLAQQYAGKRAVYLIWSGPQVKDPYYQQLLTDLESQGVRVLSQNHRFTLKQLKRSLDAKLITKGQVWIVGSSDRVLKVRRLLRKLGFKRRQLHDERMTM